LLEARQIGELPADIGYDTSPYGQIPLVGMRLPLVRAFPLKNGSLMSLSYLRLLRIYTSK
jgi:hypothetical protein